MMDPEIKAKWVEALRSGEYQQIKGQLKFRGGFCCLGVLADVAGLKINENGTQVLNENDENNSYHPLEDLLNGEFAAHELYVLNDSEGYTFPQIADYVENKSKTGLL